MKTALKSTQRTNPYEKKNGSDFTLVLAEIAAWKVIEVRFDKNLKNDGKKANEESRKEKYARIIEEQNKNRVSMAEEWVRRDTEVLPIVCSKFQEMVTSFTPENPPTGEELDQELEYSSFDLSIARCVVRPLRP